MSTHVDSQWHGQTLSIAHRSCIYHFKRVGTGAKLECVDHLDSDASVSSAPVPVSVRRELKAEGVGLIR